YVADLYEPRINHVDPRDNWDRATGRVYRIRPKEFHPAPRQDLGKKTSRELVALLGHANRWHRDIALRLLGDRKDRSVVEVLKHHLRHDKGLMALWSLWALHQVAGVDEDTLLGALGHANPHVR